MQVYANGNGNDSDCSRSGAYIKSKIYDNKIQKRNPEFCFVFRRELIVINEGLDSIMSLTQGNEMWISSRSRSFIQYFVNWHRVIDNVGVTIFEKLKRLSLSHWIHFRWILCHVDIESNDTANTLGNADTCCASAPPASLTYLELYSEAKCKCATTTTNCIIMKTDNVPENKLQTVRELQLSIREIIIDNFLYIYCSH